MKDEEWFCLGKGRKNTGATWPATQASLRPVKAGPRGHDAGASGRQDARCNNSPNRCKRPRQRTPCPTILRTPIDSTTGKVNAVLPKRAWNTLPCVTRASPCPTRQRFRSTGSLQAQSLPGEKHVLVDNGLKDSCSMQRVLLRTWFVRVTGSLCEEVSNCK